MVETLVTDSNLRALERAFKESGAPEDHLAYLRELVRTGGELTWESYQALAQLDVDVAAGYLLARVERSDLEQGKLELAAYCGHEPARLVLGAAAPAVPQLSENWVLGLSRWSRAVVVEACSLAARMALPVWESDFPNEGCARAALDATDGWLSNPTEDSIARVGEAGVEAEKRAYEVAGSMYGVFSDVPDSFHTAGVAAAGTALAITCDVDYLDPVRVFQLTALALQQTKTATSAREASGQTLESVRIGVQEVLASRALREASA